MKEMYLVKKKTLFKTGLVEINTNIVVDFQNIKLEETGLDSKSEIVVLGKDEVLKLLKEKQGTITADQVIETEDTELISLDDFAKTTYVDKKVNEEVTKQSAKISQNTKDITTDKAKIVALEAKTSGGFKGNQDKVSITTLAAPASTSDFAYYKISTGETTVLGTTVVFDATKPWVKLVPSGTPLAWKVETPLAYLANHPFNNLSAAEVTAMVANGVKDLEDRVEFNEQDIVDVQADMTYVQGEVFTIKGEVASMQTDIANADDNIVAIENEIKTIKQSVKTPTKINTKFKPDGSNNFLFVDDNGLMVAGEDQDIFLVQRLATDTTPLAVIPDTGQVFVDNAAGTKIYPVAKSKDGSQSLRYGEIKADIGNQDKRFKLVKQNKKFTSGTTTYDFYFWYTETVDDIESANVKLSNLDQEGRDKIAGIADNHIWGTPNYEVWDSFVGATNGVSGTSHSVKFNFTDDFDFDNYDSGLPHFAVINNGTKDIQIDSAGGVLTGDDGIEYTYTRIYISTTSKYCGIYFADDATRDNALNAGGLSTYKLKSITQDGFDGGLFTLNSQNLLKNDDVSTNSMNIGKNAKGSINIGDGAKYVYIAKASATVKPIVKIAEKSSQANFGYTSDRVYIGANSKKIEIGKDAAVISLGNRNYAADPEIEIGKKAKSIKIGEGDITHKPILEIGKQSQSIRVAEDIVGDVEIAKRTRGNVNIAQAHEHTSKLAIGENQGEIALGNNSNLIKIGSQSTNIAKEIHIGVGENSNSQNTKVVIGKYSSKLEINLGPRYAIKDDGFYKDNAKAFDWEQLITVIKAGIGTP